MTQKSKDNLKPKLFDMIFKDGTPRRAFYTTLIVGTIVTAINHGDVIFSGQLPSLTKVGLTYCVPYCVNTWGVILGKRAEWKKQTMGTSNKN